MTADGGRGEPFRMSDTAQSQTGQEGESLSVVQAARGLCRLLRAEGYEALFVGGCVRDRLLGLPMKDIDIATSARPEAISALLPRTRLGGVSFGVARVPFLGHGFEVTTFRRDGRYVDLRRPLEVTYGTRSDDYRRRDFTVNALFEDPETGEVIDHGTGLADLRARLLRCVGEPDERFREDALRLLRAVRFAARLDFQIEDATWAAMIRNAELISFLSAERLFDELTAMLTGPAPARALRLMDSAGMLEHLIPELLPLKGCEQGREFHPEGDVWTHTMLCLEKLEPRARLTAWATLLHDIGKPTTFVRDEATGRITFYEHQSVGARMAEEILRRLRAPAAFIDDVASVVGRHMMFMSVPQMRKSTLRRFLGAPTIEADLAVHRADCLGAHGDLAHWHFCRDALARLQQEGDEPALPKPMVTGNDLIALGWKPGPDLGAMLRRLHDQQMEGAFASREDALEAARRLTPTDSRTALP